MKIPDIYRNKKPVFSCEVFPPKPDHDSEVIYKTIGGLQEIHPDFVSVTYGAGGGTREKTLEISGRIKNDFNIESLMHLTCITNTENEIKDILDEVDHNNIKNILALRGDIPEDNEESEIEPGSSSFCYAADLVRFIKSRSPNISIGVAGYPETHPEAGNPAKDILYLKKKIEAGADFIITQLFFDNAAMYSYMERLHAKSIPVPVSAGIMPVFKAGMIKKMVKLSGATLPGKLKKIIEKYQHSNPDMEKAGIDYAVEQIDDLKRNGIDGIHLYTMNRAHLAKEISSQSGLRA